MQKMEQSQVVEAKKFWKIVRVMFFMMRRGISKGKLLAELNMSMKRAKIAGKLADIQNLMFHHAANTPPAPLNEYEFSCNNSPVYLNKRKRSQAPKLNDDEDDDDVFMEALPGFRPSPKVRQLRITDSPFPLKDIEENSHVDEAAEEFIMKFYRNLRQQNSIGYVDCS